MVCVPAPLMLNVIVFGPVVALASRTAWRSEPGPESLTLLTVKTAGAVRSSSASRRGVGAHRARVRRGGLAEPWEPCGCPESRRWAKRGQRKGNMDTSLLGGNGPGAEAATRLRTRTTVLR